MIGYKFEPLREPWDMIRRTLLNLIALCAIFLFSPAVTLENDRKCGFGVSISFVRPEPNEMKNSLKVIGEGFEPSARGPLLFLRFVVL